MIVASASYLHPKNRKPKSTGKQVEFLGKLLNHVVDENLISQLKDNWKIYQAKYNSKIDADLSLLDHYLGNILKITNSSSQPKYHILCKLVKSVLLLHNENSAIELSLSDSKNTCTKERVSLMPDTLIDLCHMKKYPRRKVGAYCINVSDKMLEGMAVAKRKDYEGVLQEKKHRN